MVTFGKPPILECSSRGDKRFSAFFAMIDGYSIEQLYQSNKIVDGKLVDNWRDAKGKKADNQEEMRELYARLWDIYFLKNPELYDVILQYNGFSDMFGQKGHACQAEEIYRIWKEKKFERKGFEF